MTNDILQTDIDLARRLLDASRPADEIVAALVYRGINPNRAAQLVADLQAGKVVEPDKPITINLPSTALYETSRPEQQQNPKAVSTELAQEASQRSRSRPRKSMPWFTLLALAAATVSVAAFVLLNRKSHSTGSADSSQAQAADEATIDSAGSNQGASLSNARAISLEIEADGVRVCGKPVTRQHFLSGIFNVLGAPDRTNDVQKADQIIYAYDNCGLLVYSPKNSGRCSILLDFDGTYGEAGTKNPFVGTFKINRRVVRHDTDAASLTSFKDVGLESPKSASGIFHAQYGAVELVFGYLKTPQRLSLIEIDFK
jgi:hypothetical protein